ncbi:MAG TPA: GntR family transcriptional regulator [Trebonia sp.]|nr:GntR family transcriptional regulator [Trebonia sp.]
MKSADAAYDAIRLQILSGSVTPGTRLIEADLARDLQTSRTPIREALRRLEAEGLLEVSPHRGARVSEWTLEDLREIYDLRSALESMAAERAAIRISEETLAELVALCDEMDGQAPARTSASRDRISALNNRYHDLVREAAASPRLNTMIQSVVQLPLVSATFHRYRAPDMQRSANQHRELIEALRVGDGQWAGAVMRAHVLAAKATLVKPDIADGSDIAVGLDAPNS